MSGRSQLHFFGGDPSKKRKKKKREFGEKCKAGRRRKIWIPIDGLSSILCPSKWEWISSSSQTKTRTAISNKNYENLVENKDVKKRRTKTSKFKSLIIEKDFEPEQPKQLEELDENTCKWPIGHPDEKSFYFCGRTSLKDFSYCKLHLLYAYQPKGKKEDVVDKEEIPEFIEKKIKSA